MRYSHDTNIFIDLFWYSQLLSDNNFAKTFLEHFKNGHSVIINSVRKELGVQDGDKITNWISGNNLPIDTDKLYLKKLEIVLDYYKLSLNDEITEINLEKK